MADQPTSRSPVRLLSDWAAVAGLIFVVASNLWNGGSTASAVQQQTADNTRRIEQLEASDQQKAGQLTELVTRTTRVETKIDLLLGRKDLTQ